MRKSGRVVCLVSTTVLLAALSTNVAFAGWDWDDSVNPKPSDPCQVVSGGSDVSTGWDWDDAVKCPKTKAPKTR